MTTTLTRKQSRMLATAQRRGQQSEPAVLDAVDIYADELPHHTTQLDIYEAAGLTRPEAFTLESHTAKIITIGRRGYIDIGRELLAAREIARHGTWRSFLERCGMPESTARNYMHVAERFAEKSATVALLPPAALYVMAAPNADPAIVDAIVSEVESGATLTTPEIRERLAPVRGAINTPDGAPSNWQQNIVGQRSDPNKADSKEPPPSTPEPLDDMIRRLDAHGYAKAGQRVKGSTTFYTFRDYRSDQDDDSAGVIELAEGELPYWLDQLDEDERRAQERQQQYLDMRVRFEALSWRLERDGRAFALYQPDGKHHGTTQQLDPMLKLLVSLEKQVAAAPKVERLLPPDFAEAQKRAAKLGLHIDMNMAGEFSIKNERSGRAELVGGITDWQVVLDRLDARERYLGDDAPAATQPSSYIWAVLDHIESIAGQNLNGITMGQRIIAQIKMARDHIADSQPTLPRRPRSADASAQIAYTAELEQYIVAISKLYGVKR